MRPSPFLRPFFIKQAQKVCPVLPFLHSSSFSVEYTLLLGMGLLIRAIFSQSASLSAISELESMCRKKNARPHHFTDLKWWETRNYFPLALTQLYTDNTRNPKLVAWESLVLKTIKTMTKTNTTYRDWIDFVLFPLKSAIEKLTDANFSFSEWGDRGLSAWGVRMPSDIIIWLEICSVIQK